MAAPGEGKADRVVQIQPRGPETVWRVGDAARVSVGPEHREQRDVSR